MKTPSLRAFASGSLALLLALGLTSACGDDDEKIDPGGEGGEGGDSGSGGAPSGGAPGTGGRATGGEGGGAPVECTADCGIFDTESGDFFSFDEAEGTTHFTLRTKDDAPELVSARVRLTVVECSELQYGYRSMETFQLTRAESGEWTVDLTELVTNYNTLIVEDFTIEAVTCDGEALVVAQAVNTENWNRDPLACDGVGIGTFEGFAWCPTPVAATPPVGELEYIDPECSSSGYVCEMTSGFYTNYWQPEGEYPGGFSVYLNENVGQLTDAKLALFKCECDAESRACVPDTYSIEYVEGEVYDGDGYYLEFEYNESLGDTYRAVVHLRNECEEQSFVFWNQHMVCGNEPGWYSDGICLTEGPVRPLDLDNGPF